MMAPIDPAEQREGLPGDCGWAARHVPRVSCWAARHVPPRFLSSFFPQERHQAPPWRCGAGLTSELFRRARYEFFFLAPEASWGAPPWRCGAGFNSEFLLRSRCPFQKKKKKKSARPRRSRSWLCVRFVLPPFETSHDGPFPSIQRSREGLPALTRFPALNPRGPPTGCPRRFETTSRSGFSLGTGAPGRHRPCRPLVSAPGPGACPPPPSAAATPGERLASGARGRTLPPPRELSAVASRDVRV